MPARRLDMATVSRFLKVSQTYLDAHPSVVQKNFVKVVRAIELSLGVAVPGVSPIPGIVTSRNVTAALTSLSNAKDIFSEEIRQVLKDMVPVFAKVAVQLAMNLNLDKQDLRAALRKKKALTTTYVHG